MSESVLGGLTALAAVVGAVSTLLYPLLLARLGLNKTGLLGFTLQASCLLLSVASVWAPGSPFSLSSTSLEGNSTFSPSPENSSHIPLEDISFLSLEENTTYISPPSNTSSNPPEDDSSYISVSLLLTGESGKSPAVLTSQSQGSSPAGRECCWPTSLSTRYSRRRFRRTTEVRSEGGES